MPSTKFTLSLQKFSCGCCQANLSDGIQEVTIPGSHAPEETLLPLLWAVRSLLLGADESTCSWLSIEDGEYRWLFSRTEKLIQIHIVRPGKSSWMDKGGWRFNAEEETVLRMECDLLAFAKRLAHQLGQIEYQEGKPAVPQEEYQKLKDAITIFEHANSGKRT